MNTEEKENFFSKCVYLLFKEYDALQLSCYLLLIIDDFLKIFYRQKNTSSLVIEGARLSLKVKPNTTIL